MSPFLFKQLPRSADTEEEEDKGGPSAVCSSIQPRYARSFSYPKATSKVRVVGECINRPHRNERCYSGTGRQKAGKKRSANISEVNQIGGRHLWTASAGKRVDPRMRRGEHVHPSSPVWAARKTQTSTLCDFATPGP